LCWAWRADLGLRAVRCCPGAGMPVI
jgi:hypothetical protein